MWQITACSADHQFLVLGYIDLNFGFLTLAKEHARHRGKLLILAKSIILLSSFKNNHE